jgi:hypothetical protein
VQLVLALVDTPILGHEGADLLLPLLNSLRKLTAEVADGALRKVGNHLGINEEDFLDGISHDIIF